MDIREKIIKLKQKEEAIILAHNYQRPEVQEIADYVGSSLQLCLKACESDARCIVFCGVDFMAESAAILNPDKVVLIPVLNSRCPMAAMLPASLILESKGKYPDAGVMLYVNTLAEAKAVADIICTSTNAIQVARRIPSKEILFGPDWNLAWYVQRNCPEKKIIPIPEHGYCYVHKLFGAETLFAKEDNPDAELLVHPECDPEIQLKADFIGSTGQMYKRCFESGSEKFIIATEIGLIDRLKRELPRKTYIPALQSAICKEMKLHTLEKVYLALREKENVVRVPEEIAIRARKSVEKMLRLF
jgi:quinolinate synthase